MIQVLPGPPSRNEIRQFLASRRPRITPEQAGRPTYGGNRRVAGLRREEVALLAGVSVDYYTRLERDILATNRLGYALYSELYGDPVRPANVARFVFLSPQARAFFPDWERAANDLVANLRTEAGRNPTTGGCRTWSGSCPLHVPPRHPGEPRRGSRDRFGATW